MEPFLQPDSEGIRISHSPRRSPQITQALTSPIRSVHAMQMDSLHSQPDIGMRTADFFDDSSEDERTHTQLPGDVAFVDAPVEGRSKVGKKKRRTASTTELFATHEQEPVGHLEPDQQGYQPLPGDGDPRSHHDLVETASSSFNGSVDELLQSTRQQRSSPPVKLPSRITNERTPRSSTNIERTPDNRHASMPLQMAVPTLGAYAIAHEITLNALMRDEEALDKSLHSFALAPLQTLDRHSMPPEVLDPRSPRYRNFSSPATSTPKKSVHVVPPPIDTSVPRKSIPEDIVRTPYPFSPETVRRKDFGQLSPPPASANSASSTESILIVSIRRSNANSKLRITSLTIPASNDFTAVRSSSIGAKERHFKALDFDDAELFLQLRQCYAELSGVLRFLGARSLTRIAVSGPASKAADLGYGWRSPRLLAYKGLSDTFSEEQILRHYRNPALGQSRYAFVHWAHRLASTTAPRTPNSAADSRGDDRKPSLGGKEQPEGLEFIVAWSVRRIIAVLALVIAVSVAAALLWIFLGRSTAGEEPPQGGFRDAGDRVATGVLIGICCLLFGLSSMVGWLGLSWLLM